MQLTKDNIILYAAKNYHTPKSIDSEEFFSDLKRFKYIKRLLKRYKNTGELKVPLLINHFIVLYNIFGEAATPMLFFKIEKELWSTMKTFILFLNKIPEYPKCYLHDIPVDLNCLKELQKIFKANE